VVLELRQIEVQTGQGKSLALALQTGAMAAAASPR
jgi:hypothetical protein